MHATGLSSIDETVVHTLLWVDEVCTELGDADRAHGWSALRAVLQHLRELVGDDEAAQLGAQLPLLLRGLYYEGYDPRPVIDPERELDLFLWAVERRLGTQRVDPAEAAVAVFAVLGRHLGGEAVQVRERLSPPIRALWPTTPAKIPRARSAARASAPPRQPRARRSRRAG